MRLDTFFSSLNLFPFPLGISSLLIISFSHVDEVIDEEGGDSEERGDERNGE